MMLMWKIRYFDRIEKQFKDRYLHLRTEALDFVTRAAIELATENKSGRTPRAILRFRHLFRETSLEEVPKDWQNWKGMRGIGTENYFEDQNGNEFHLSELANSSSNQNDKQKTNPTPIPLEEVQLAQEEIRLFGYFTRDFKEISDSTLMKEGPGTLSSFAYETGHGPFPYTFETALTDDEIRSFVTIYRRIYMDSEPANLKKAVSLFVRVVGDHPHTRLLQSFASEYEAHLSSLCTKLPGPGSACQFTIKRLIDVFLYTQYAHQPDEKRQKQFKECLIEVQGNHSHLTWMFMYAIWSSSIHIINSGRVINNWLKRYCTYHGVFPDVLNSLRHEGVGFGALEKKDDIETRLFREKVEILEVELWKQAGRPEGGPVQFRLMAQDQLKRALGQ
jgi:hypothetical protein